MSTSYDLLLEECISLITEYEIKDYTFVITGSAGFIGRNLMQIFQSAGINTIGIDLNEVSNDTKSISNSNSKVYRCNLLDKHSINQVASGCNNEVIILHLSSPLINKSSSDIKLNNSKDITQIEEVFDKNATVISNLFEAFGKKIRHFIYFSTIDVYGENNHRENQINILTPAVPDSFYSHVKYQGELITRILAQEHLIPFNIFRLGQVYGPYEGNSYNRLIPLVIDKFLSNSELNLWLNKKTVRQYISPIEIAGYIFESIVLCSSNKLIYQNIVGDSTKLLDIVNTCQQIIGFGRYNLIEENETHLYSTYIRPAEKYIIKDLSFSVKSQLIKENLTEQIKIQKGQKMGEYS